MRTSKLEADYQSQLIEKLRALFPGCIILKNDSSYQQGIPDLTVLWRDRWAFLEVKAFENAPEQPNQRYFIELADTLSFGAFIYPENEREVLHGLQAAFRTRRKTRLPKSE